MRDEVAILVGAVSRGILTAEEALAKDYLSADERERLRALLAE